ncbi:MAG: hypothetical protein U0002_08785 [Thermoanaerobaculia bacterium]
MGVDPASSTAPQNQNLHPVVVQPSQATQPAKSPQEAAAKRGAAAPVDVFERPAANSQPNVFLAQANRAGQVYGPPAPPKTFGTEGTTIPKGTGTGSGPQAKPEEAAAFVKHLDEVGSFGGGPSPAANLFAQQLAAHKGDADWTQKFYQSLGADLSAKMINQSVDPSYYRDWKPETVNQQIDAVRGSLTTLYQAGKLNQADMDRLMNHWTHDSDSQVWNGIFDGGYRVNPGLAQLFRDVPYTAEGLKNEFFDSAVKASQDTKLGQEERNDAAAAAAWVLSGTSADNQVVQLRTLQQQNGLGDFVTRAMSGEKNVPTLLNSAQNPIDPKTGRPSRPIEERYDGMARIAFNLAYSDVSLRDAFNRAAPFTQGELSKIRQEVFVSASTAMEAHPRTWDDNTLLKDGLSQIFQSEFDNLWQGNLAGNQASLKNKTIQEGLESFFEHALFTGPSGNLRDSTSRFLADKLRGWIDDIRNPNLSDAQFKAKYGVDQTQLAKIAGEILGHVSNGMERAIDGATDKQKAKEAILKTGFDLALSLLPAGGPIKALGGGKIGEIGVKALDSFVSKLDGDLRKQLETAGYEEAKKLLVEKLPDFVNDQALKQLADDLMDVIPESNARNYLSAFQSSFTDIDRKYGKVN